MGVRGVMCDKAFYCNCSVTDVTAMKAVKGVTRPTIRCRQV